MENPSKKFIVAAILWLTTYPYAHDGGQHWNGHLAMQCDKGDGIISTYLERLEGKNEWWCRQLVP
jgi:hypothetical protein